MNVWDLDSSHQRLCAHVSLPWVGTSTGCSGSYQLAIKEARGKRQKNERIKKLLSHYIKRIWVQLCLISVKAPFQDLKRESEQSWGVLFWWLRQTNSPNSPCEQRQDETRIAPVHLVIHLSESSSERHKSVIIFFLPLVHALFFVCLTGSATIKTYRETCWHFSGLSIVVLHGSSHCVTEDKNKAVIVSAHKCRSGEKSVLCISI